MLAQLGCRTRNLSLDSKYCSFWSEHRLAPSFAGLRVLRCSTFEWARTRSQVTKDFISSLSQNPKYSRPRLADKYSLHSSCIPVPSFESLLAVKQRSPNAYASGSFVLCCQAGTRTPIPWTRTTCPTIRRPGNIYLQPKS